MAARMKLVLTQDVENLGSVGEVVTVRGGYGRNYLIPQGKALPATRAHLAVVESQRKVFEEAALKQRNQAAEMANRIGNLELSIARKAGEADTLYGSVTNGDIADAMAAEGLVVDKRRVLLVDPIKSLGVYQVPVRLHPEVTAELKVWVVAEESA
ncbi:MAG: 50S ribosomal protein L9 [Acidobacteriota bacterium]